MMWITFVLYLLFLVAWMVFMFFFMWYMVSLTLSLWHGAPFVPTDQNKLKSIFARAKLQKGQKFLELGSGDARVSRVAVKEFGVVARGVEVQWLWLAVSWVINRVQGVKMELQHGYIEKADLRWADVIYIFMMPRFLKKFQSRLEADARPGTVIISHGFPIDCLEAKEIDRIDDKPYKTYVYRI
jgi:hypothetical protein